MTTSNEVAWLFELELQPGCREQFETLMPEMIEATRANEPGCLAYVVHRSHEEPSRFQIYELYVDEDAFQHHLESEHFRTLALEDGIPRLSSRTREFFALVA